MVVGNSLTTRGSFVPTTVKMASLLSSDIFPVAIMDAARSCVVFIASMCCAFGSCGSASLVSSGSAFWSCGSTSSRSSGCRLWPEEGDDGDAADDVDGDADADACVEADAAEEVDDVDAWVGTPLRMRSTMSSTGTTGAVG